MKRHLLSAILMMLAIVPSLTAQEIKLTASARGVVSVGDRFQLTYTLNTKGGQFTGPEIDHFRVLSGPNVSTNQSYQVVNGKMSQSISVNYIYYLQAFEEGTFEIPPASVDIKGEVYSSKPVAIQVVKGNAPPDNAAGNNTGGQPGANITSDDVFLKASVSKLNPYQGEQVVVSFRLYSAGIPISEIDISKLTSFPGFWVTNLSDERQNLVQDEEIINGKEYISAELFKVILFPQKSGEIIIEPKTLNCMAQQRVQGSKRVRDPFFDSFFDDPFFNNQYRNVPLEIKSNQIKLNVKPLPIANKPAGFSGAVGKYGISASIDNNEIRVNDAVTLKVNITGTGNLELINTPEVNWPPDFETYEPKISKNIKARASGVTGSRSFEYLAIARSAGKFTVGPIELSYFDPVTGQYKNVSTQAFSIQVEKGDQPAASVTYSGVAQEDIMYLGQDIRYIKTGVFSLNAKGQYLFLSPLYYILLVIPVILVTVIAIVVSGSRKRRSNVAMVRNRKATKVARKNLRAAKEFLKAQKREEFYTEVSRALWGYLSNKFNIPLSGLSMDTVRGKLSDKDVSAESIDSFIEVLNKCEFARFAPGESSNLMNEIYQDAILFISRIESELKS